MGDKAFFAHDVAREPLQEVLILSQQTLWTEYGILRNAPNGAIDKDGLACRPDTCDDRKLTLLTVTSVGAP